MPGKRPPGATIRDHLQNRHMNQKEFAVRIGLSEKHISRLINGKVELTQEVALRLESVLGVPARDWNNMEAVYREDIARSEEEKNLDQDAQDAPLYPYDLMADLGWVPQHSDAYGKARALRQFFEVARLDILTDLQVPGVAAEDPTLMVWAQKARLMARTVRAGSISISKLERSLPTIRTMTRRNLERFRPDLVEVCRSCGIVLVFPPDIGGTFPHGATFQDGDHLVIGLRRGSRDAAQFWADLLHELGHILHGHLGKPFALDPEYEQEADAFAREMYHAQGMHHAMI